MTSNLRHLPWHANDQLPTRDARDWVTSLELRDEAHITYRQLDYWCRTGLLVPIEQPNPGSGHLRRFPEDQVQRATAIAHLLAGGMSLVVVRRVLDDLLTHGAVQLGALTVQYHPSHTSTGDTA